MVSRCLFSTARPLVASLILQRNPIVLAPLSPFEKEYKLYQENIKLEQSRGAFNIKDSLNELCSSTPTASAEVKNTLLQDELEQAIKQAQQQYEPFQNNQQSLKRALDRVLYLVMLEAKSSLWRFPYQPYQDTTDEGLHVTAKRSIADVVDGKSDIYHVGKGPVATHKWPDSAEFFFRAQILSGGIRPEDFANGNHPYSQYAWLTKKELEERFEPLYFASVRDCLSL